MKSLWDLTCHHITRTTNSELNASRKHVTRELRKMEAEIVYCFLRKLIDARIIVYLILEFPSNAMPAGFAHSNRVSDQVHLIPCIHTSVKPHPKKILTTNGNHLREEKKEIRDPRPNEYNPSKTPRNRPRT